MVLFNQFLNYLWGVHSESFRFTDDTTIIMCSKMPSYVDELHENVTELYEWAEKWQKNFVVGNVR